MKDQGVRYELERKGGGWPSLAHPNYFAIDITNGNQVGQFPHCGFQRFFRVLGGQYQGNAFAVDHAMKTSIIL